MNDVRRRTNRAVRSLGLLAISTGCAVQVLSRPLEAEAATGSPALGPKARALVSAQVDQRATARRLCLREHKARWKRCPGKKYVWSEKRTKCLASSSGLYATCLEKALPSYDPLVRGARCRERAFIERLRKNVAACDRAERAARRGKRPNWPYSDLW